MKKQFLLKLIFIVSYVLLLTGCGGDGTAPAPEGNSNWDQMVWDQDNWK